ncbi:MAG: flagellar basal-body rod protein FlgG [Polynucleobacter sp.]|jgi:flagellar basal-body rod protein FlgG|nr:flagellar basal-body rod protein FlgG [Polynucleobacter sp.]
MLRSLWIAKTGMDAQQTSIDLISNNLANASTTGFKKIQPIFQDLLYTTIRAAGAAANAQNLLPTGLQVGAGSAITTTERVNIQGPLTNTGNTYDVAIQGNGYFQIQLSDGSLAYTRNGTFSKNATGQIVTSDGNTVSGAGVIPVTATGVFINTAGLVQYTVQGSTALNTAGTIVVANFANESGLTSIGNGNYIATPSSGTAQTQTAGTNGMGTVNQFFLENSNVNVSEELVKLIAAQRGFEINTRAVSASDQILQKLSTLGQ